MAASADELSKANIYIGAAPEAEARHYAKEIADVFSKSGVKTMGVVVGAGGKPGELQIKVRDTAHPSAEAQTLLETIRDAGFEVSLAPWENEDADNHSVELFVSAN